MYYQMCVLTTSFYVLAIYKYCVFEYSKIMKRQLGVFRYECVADESEEESFYFPPYAVDVVLNHIASDSCSCGIHFPGESKSGHSFYNALIYYAIVKF